MKRSNFNVLKMNPKFKQKTIGSLIVNSLIVLMVIAATIWGVAQAPKTGYVKSGAELFKFFTTLSNDLVGIVAIFLIVYESLLLRGEIKKIPTWVYALKFVGTVSVALTFFTVMLFLAPAGKIDPMILFRDSNFLFHVIIPLASMVSYIVCEHNEMHLSLSALGIAPTFVYAIFYCAVAFTHIDPTTGVTTDWLRYDWYGFVQVATVRYVWVVLFIMFGATYLLSWLLWLTNRKMHIGENKAPYIIRRGK